MTEQIHSSWKKVSVLSLNLIVITMKWNEVSSQISQLIKLLSSILLKLYSIFSKCQSAHKMFFWDGDFQIFSGIWTFSFLNKIVNFFTNYFLLSKILQFVFFIELNRCLQSEVIWIDCSAVWMRNINVFSFSWINLTHNLSSNVSDNLNDSMLLLFNFLLFFLFCNIVVHKYTLSSTENDICFLSAYWLIFFLRLWCASSFQQFSESLLDSVICVKWIHHISELYS